MANLDIHGVLPPMLTPFTQNGDVDYDGHIGNIKRWNGHQLGGYVVLGTNSETPYLTEAEKVKLIELTVQYAAKGRMIFAGTGLESTRETVRLTNCAAELGVHAALVLTPCFYGSQMNDETLIHHFRQVADASRIPILIYNMPANTHLNISIEAVRVLSEHPNIIGMKDSSGDVPRLASLINVVPKTFNLIVGTASAWYPALTLGVRAGILAFANFAGSQCAEVQRLFDAGKHNEARALYLKL
ncbi:MAG: dihydrodipicolinate synthase family protein, partial [Ignavibacteriales bacterium]|nr:dihydrodipicolinate synthase family protein [Ignavibacteriales bacterium]